MVGRLIARRAHGDGGLGQAKGQRLPCQRVVAEEVAQVAGGVVEVKYGGGGNLGEQRFEDGRVRGYDGFEQAEDDMAVLQVLERIACERSDGRGGGGGQRASWAPELVLLGEVLRAHACPARQREALSKLKAHETILTDEARRHTRETCRGRGEGDAAGPAASHRAR